ncbi:vacuolar protein 14 C-terminal Fig4p binding-domain-containing protein [Phycomyces nitens]|nr:vacuolar protein 14 C-terminal Fig4p binding-domain-containing protein [Phycomyces nitens]
MKGGFNDDQLITKSDKIPEQITSIIETLVQDFVYSNSPNHRNGGLIALAAVTIALGPDIALNLDIIIPPILSCFNNQDSKVRYYACESMYNIAKVAKGEALRFFNGIFDALSTLSEDTEMSVKNGADFLDRLIKDIVLELATTYVSPFDPPGQKTTFSLPNFIPLLSSKISTKHSFTRNYLVLWISNLESIPELGLISYLHEFLDGLLDFMSDSSEDVRVATEQLLENFLMDIMDDCYSRQAAEEGSYGEEETEESNDHDTERTLKGKSVEKNTSPPANIHYGRIIEILVPHLSSQNEDIQKVALRWTSELINNEKDIIIQFTPQIIYAVLPSLSHALKEVKMAAARANLGLQRLVLETPVMESNEVEDPFDYQMTVTNLRLQFLNEHEETRIASLDWLLMLHKKAPYKILASDDGTFPVLLKTLSDSSEEVIRRDLQLLAQISSYSDNDYFRSFMMNLVSLFSTDRRLLENRGSLIIRQLCTSLDPERIYITLADVLEKDEDLEFANIMVQNLNVILITSAELADLRKRLRNLDTKDGQQLFISLYKSWCHSAVATLSLCLLAQAYEHAANMLQIFAELDITVNTLIQIDKLVQLIESPVFTYLRLQLLEPEKYPHLLKCLYGLLMLLPQSSAFSTLRSRLSCVSSIGFLHFMPKSPIEAPKKQPTKSISNGHSKVIEDPIKFNELLQHFRNVQLRHERSRKQGKDIN